MAPIGGIGSWHRVVAMGMLDSSQWLYLGLAYIAGDSAEKAMAALSKK